MRKLVGVMSNDMLNHSLGSTRKQHAMLSKVTRRFLNYNQIYCFASQHGGDHHKLSASDEAYLNEVRQRYVTPDMEKWAYLDYKKHPSTTLSHYDHKSKDYVHSERDEYNADVATNNHNKLIDDFKRNLQMQRKVHDILQKMDRPYLRGVPGVTKNVSAGLQDYSTPVSKKSQADPNDFYRDAYRNENRWIDQTIFTPKTSKMTHYDVEWPKELASRPVTKKFHHDKGYKYDVTTPYDQRYNYVADRLGHPEILGNPFERLMRLEGDIYHPNYLDQPFVKVPNANPNTSLNFEEGEVLYENTRLLEWAKFWNYSVVVGYLWCAYFVPYNIFFKTHMPLEHAFDNLFFPYFQHTHFFWDNNALHIPTVGGVAIYATYIALSYINNIWKDYVVRAQFSKDKELLFVTRVSPFGTTEEEVYETAHLEHLPPSVRSGVKDLSAQDADGLVDITCMSSQRSLVFYKGDQYWNPKVYNDFINQTSNLWTRNYTGYNRFEVQNSVEQVKVGFSQSSQPKLEKK